MVTSINTMILSVIEAWHVILYPVDIYTWQAESVTINPIHACGGQSAHDDVIAVIKPTSEMANVAYRTGFVANQ